MENEKLKEEKPRPVCARCGCTKQYSGWCGECFAWTETGKKPIHADNCECNDCLKGKQ